ncbi:uncharacterized protein CYBJADRAFT_167476, partial [Cyberlindnera jadinii NRRL Y-1542]
MRLHADSETSTCMSEHEQFDMRFLRWVEFRTWNGVVRTRHAAALNPSFRR